VEDLRGNWGVSTVQSFCIGREVGLVVTMGKKLGTPSLSQISEKALRSLLSLEFPKVEQEHNPRSSGGSDGGK